MPPRWVVTCPECNRELTYTLIDRLVPGKGSRDPFASPPKPNISVSGADLKCHKCGKTATYRAFDLRYRTD